MSLAFARLSAILVLASATPLGAGCRSSSASACVSVCTDTIACKGAAQSDCVTTCAQLTTLDTAAGCSAPFDALLRCQAGLPSVCKSSPCDAALDAWRACLEPYCTKNPATAGCK